MWKEPKPSLIVLLQRRGGGLMLGTQSDAGHSSKVSGRVRLPQLGRVGRRVPADQQHRTTQRSDARRLNFNAQLHCSDLQMMNSCQLGSFTRLKPKR